MNLGEVSVCCMYFSSKCLIKIKMLGIVYSLFNLVVSSANCENLTLCLDRKLGEKRKKGKGTGRNGNVGEGKRGKEFIVCIGRKGMEKKVIFHPNISSYEEI